MSSFIGPTAYVHSLWEVLPLGKMFAQLMPCQELGKHPDYQMKMISIKNTMRMIPVEKITHGINVQHNCIDGGCKT
ncbi:hypothetical protein VP01_966g5, partial [Puccinia sorghi]